MATTRREACAHGIENDVCWQCSYERLAAHLRALPEHERHLLTCPERAQAYWRMRPEYRPVGYVDKPCACAAGGVS